MKADRHRIAWLIFGGIAEVSAKYLNMQIVAPIDELNRFGCVVKTSASIPVGTEITLTIIHNGEYFTAPAKVKYVSPERGLGIVFSEVGTRDAALLEDWLSQSD